MEIVLILFIVVLGLALAFYPGKVAGCVWKLLILFIALVLILTIVIQCQVTGC